MLHKLLKTLWHDLNKIKRILIKIERGSTKIESTCRSWTWRALSTWFACVRWHHTPPPNCWIWDQRASRWSAKIWSKSQLISWTKKSANKFSINSIYSRFYKTTCPMPPYSACQVMSSRAKRIDRLSTLTSLLPPNCLCIRERTTYSWQLGIEV